MPELVEGMKTIFILPTLLHTSYFGAYAWDYHAPSDKTSRQDILYIFEFNRPAISNTVVLQLKSCESYVPSCVGRYCPSSIQNSIMITVLRRPMQRI